MSREPPPYHAFLLRLWRVKENGQYVWRASLDDARGGPRRGFASLAEACDYVQALIDEPPSSAPSGQVGQSP